MAEEKPSQSISISGDKISNVKIEHIAGGDMNITQSQQIFTGESNQELTSVDVVKLIVQLEDIFRSADLPEAQNAKAIKHLETAKEEAQETEPDKEFAAKNLQRATKIFKEAGETVEAGTSLWQQVKPILKILSPWLGVAVSFFV